MQKSFGPIKIPSTSVSGPAIAVPVGVVSKETEQFDTFDKLSAGGLTAEGLAKREGILEERERQIEQTHKILEQKLDQAEKLRIDLVEKLEKSAKMSAEQAQKILLEQIEKDLTSEISKKIKQAEDEIKLQAEKYAKEILSEAMLHGVTDYIAEFTTSRVDLANEEMKGRIIGKEGRNIRSFEQATGVDVVMDDEMPNSLILSSFDPIRREIAKVALERLIADERIHPQRIEEVVEKTKQDIEKTITQAGEELCFKAGVFNLPLEVVNMLGRFKYRYSYGQSLVQHSLELVQIGVEMAKAIGADVNIVRLGCLLHDVGKVVYEGEEGTHVEKGVKFLKQFDIPQVVIDCVAQHHEDEPFTSVESILVAISDAISGGRPGARHENVQDYIKRLENIERIATSYDGVEKCFAVQAGREVRVIVVPEKISDDELPKLVHDIGEQIQKQVMVPGAVKVTAVREVRAQESFLTSGG